MLIVVSDGAPVDDSTLLANGLGYLMDHLKSVLDDLRAAGDIKVAALGIGFPVDAYYPYSVKIEAPKDLGGGLLTLVKECLADPANVSSQHVH